MYADRVKKMYTNKPKQTPRPQEEGSLPPASNSSWRRAQGTDDSLQPFSWKKVAAITFGSQGGRAQHQLLLQRVFFITILTFYWTLNHRTIATGLRIALCCILIRMSN